MKKQIREMVLEALRQFYMHDLELLENPYEPTVSAKIGMYLQALLTNCAEFNGYHVDCEYNRAAMGKKVAPEKYPYKTMRPDILIHRRAHTEKESKRSDFNFLFCEIKIGNISDNDITKINHAIDEYHYAWGLSIHNIEQKGIVLRWVQNGQNANNEKLDVTYTWKDHDKQLVPENDS